MRQTVYGTFLTQVSLTMRVTWQGTCLRSVTGTFLHTVYGTFSMTHSLTVLVHGTVLQTVWHFHTLRVHCWSDSWPQLRCQRVRLYCVWQLHGSKQHSPPSFST